MYNMRSEGDQSLDEFDRADSFVNDLAWMNLLVKSCDILNEYNGLINKSNTSNLICSVV